MDRTEEVTQSAKGYLNSNTMCVMHPTVPKKQIFEFNYTCTKIMDGVKIVGVDVRYSLD